MSADSLSNAEILRYSRQLLVPDFGVKGQLSLRNSSALVVGCGGLGCPAAIFLAAAGIGTLGLLDYDVVELTNLHRQILHKEGSVGEPKCNSARDACHSLNSTTRYVTHNLSLDSGSALDIVGLYDVVLDCTDNVATRYLLNDACVLAGKPLVSGAALKMEGQLTVYNHGGGPCYRCLYPSPPPAHAVTSCSEGGVLGVVPGIIGTMQAQEAIKILTEMEGVLSGRLFLYDALRFSTRVIRLRPKQSSCVVCGDAPTVTKLVDYIEFCGSQPHDKLHSVSLPDVRRVTAGQYKAEYLDKATDHVLIDTRPSHELDICRLPNTTNIPLSRLTKMTGDDLKETLARPDLPSLVCVCHNGNDSQIASQHIGRVMNGSPCDVVDIIGGLEAWSKQVDSSFPRY